MGIFYKLVAIFLIITVPIISYTIIYYKNRPLQSMIDYRSDRWSLMNLGGILIAMDVISIAAALIVFILSL